MRDLGAVRRAYADWLAEYPWNWFCTLTFANPPHPEKAEKCFGYWIHQINQLLHGRRYQKNDRSIYWALALEYHKSGVIHFHALLGDSPDINLQLTRKHAKQLWEDLAGWSRIRRIDHRLRAVTGYVSKYVTKGGELTVGPMTPPPGQAIYRAVQCHWQLPIGIHSSLDD